MLRRNKNDKTQVRRLRESLAGVLEVATVLLRVVRTQAQEIRHDRICGSWTHFAGEYALSIYKSQPGYRATLYRESSRGAKRCDKEFLIECRGGELWCRECGSGPDRAGWHPVARSQADTLTFAGFGPYYRDNHLARP